MIVLISRCKEQSLSVSLRLWPGLADLHPLALEDVLTQRGHARSKADYYPQHLFIRVLNHTLAAEDERAGGNTTFAHLPRSESPSPMDDDDADEDDSEYQLGARKTEFDVDEKTVYGGASADASRFSTMNNNGLPRGGGSGGRRFGSAPAGGDVESRQPQSAVQARFAGVADERAQKDARNRKLLRELKRGDRVNVKIQPMCLFLFRDGTVISIHKGEWAILSCNGDGDGNVRVVG